MTATHLLRAHNLRVGHIRGVQPVPVTLTGDTDGDRHIMTEALVDIVRRVLDRAPMPTIRWNPDGEQALAYVPVTVDRRTRQKLVATFRVEKVRR